MKIVNVGQFCVVYFCPIDIASAEPGAEPEAQNLPCTEQYNFEAEMINIIREDDDEELEDITKKKLEEIFSSKDKVKGAKQLELLVTQQIELPRNYYFAGVKDKSGNESIALRWKYTKRAGKNQTTEVTKSLINIYDNTKDGVFVADFDDKSMFKLPSEVETLIKNILEFIGAEETNDKCVYSLEIKDKDKDKDNTKEKYIKIKDNWQYLKHMNVCKANLLITGKNSLPTNKLDINQLSIFEKQLLLYINTNNSVAILNSFPIFLFEYFK